MVFDVSLKIQSDSNYVDVQDDEITEPVHTIKSAYVLDICPCVYHCVTDTTIWRLPVTISNGLNARQSKTKQFSGIHKFGKFIGKILFRIA